MRKVYVKEACVPLCVYASVCVCVCVCGEGLVRVCEDVYIWTILKS